MDRKIDKQDANSAAFSSSTLSIRDVSLLSMCCQAPEPQWIGANANG